MYERKQVSVIRKRLQEPRRTIMGLVGPRQVGKTTLIRQAMQGVTAPLIYENADGVLRSGDAWLEDTWLRARAAAANANGTSVLVIDEIQKIESWSETVKKLWDADSWNSTDVRVIVLGSSTVLLNRGLRESLAGRFELLRVMPWSFREMSDAFGLDLETYALYGGYPGSIPYIDDIDRWAAYMMDSIVEPVILKDIVQLQRIEKPALMRQLLLQGAQMSSREVSFTKLLGLLNDAGNTTTLVNYLDLLDEAGVLSGLSKYRTSPMQKRSSPKMQVFANGMATACGARWRRGMESEDRGRCYESLVGAHLRSSVLGTLISLHWWRDGNDEVDYVLSRGEDVLAIEATTSATHSYRGLDAFKKLNPGAKTMLVGGDGFPIDEFLERTPHELFELVA